MKTILLLLFLSLIITSCEKTTGDYVNNPGISDHLHNRQTGASANDILSSSKYTSLKVEIQYMTGYVPDAGALAHLQAMLSGIVNKPAGISIVAREIPAAANPELTVSDVITIERNNRTEFTNGSQLALYILYTNGNFTEQNVLGVAYKNTSAVVFGKKIQDNSGGLGQPGRTKLLATVLEHEMGHLMGLVDLGTPMQTGHKDPAHGSHCNNSSCLMYYASETSDILGFLITGNIPVLDAACRADLRANGGQ